jgi:hypothetical protein
LGHRAQLGLRDHKVQLGHKDRPDLKVLRVRSVLKGLQVHKDQSALKAHRARRVLRGLLALKAQPGHKVLTQPFPVLPDHKEQPDRKELKVLLRASAWLLL